MSEATTLGGDRVARRVLRARWRDLDPLGHVNTAVFLTYLEEVRDAWLVETFGPGFRPENYVVARVELDFRHEIVHGQEFEALCRLAAVGRRSITTHEELRGADGTLLAEATVVIVLWQADARSSRPLTAEEHARLAAGEGT